MNRKKTTQTKMAGLMRELHGWHSVRPSSESIHAYWNHIRAATAADTQRDAGKRNANMRKATSTKENLNPSSLYMSTDGTVVKITSLDVSCDSQKLIQGYPSELHTVPKLFRAGDPPGSSEDFYRMYLRCPVWGTHRNPRPAYNERASRLMRTAGPIYGDVILSAWYDDLVRDDKPGGEGCLDMTLAKLNALEMDPEHNFSLGVHFLNGTNGFEKCHKDAMRYFLNAHEGGYDPETMKEHFTPELNYLGESLSDGLPSYAKGTAFAAIKFLVELKVHEEETKTGRRKSLDTENDFWNLAERLASQRGEGVDISGHYLEIRSRVELKGLKSVVLDGLKGRIMR